MGDVGIGTATPTSALQVEGYIQFDTVNTTPPAAHCTVTTRGRTKVNPAGALYVCMNVGWVNMKAPGVITRTGTRPTCAGVGPELGRRWQAQTWTVRGSTGSVPASIHRQSILVRFRENERYDAVDACNNAGGNLVSFCHRIDWASCKFIQSEWDKIHCLHN